MINDHHRLKSRYYTLIHVTVHVATKEEAHSVIQPHVRVIHFLCNGVVLNARGVATDDDHTNRNSQISFAGQVFNAPHQSVHLMVHSYSVFIERVVHSLLFTISLVPPWLVYAIWFFHQKQKIPKLLSLNTREQYSEGREREKVKQWRWCRHPYQ